MALAEWLRVRDYLLYGRELPAIDTEAITVEQSCFGFLEHKERLVTRKELNPRTLQTNSSTCKTVAEFLGRPRQESIDAAKEAPKQEHGARVFEAHEIPSPGTSPVGSPLERKVSCE